MKERHYDNIHNFTQFLVNCIRVKLSILAQIALIDTAPMQKYDYIFFELSVLLEINRESGIFHFHYHFIGIL